MNVSWEEEFKLAMASFGEIVPEPIEYRLHYDNSGAITMCSMQNHPDSIQYLVVGKEEYENYTLYKVDIVNKKLKKVVLDPGVSVQLKRSNQGFKTVKHHAGLIVEPDETYEDIEYYDRTN